MTSLGTGGNAAQCVNTFHFTGVLLKLLLRYEHLTSGNEQYKLSQKRLFLAVFFFILQPPVSLYFCNV